MGQQSVFKQMYHLTGASKDYQELVMPNQPVILFNKLTGLIEYVEHSVTCLQKAFDKISYEIPAEKMRIQFGLCDFRKMDTKLVEQLYLLSAAFCQAGKR